jgi:hypothetical protein
VRGNEKDTGNEKDRQLGMGMCFAVRTECE